MEFFGIIFIVMFGFILFVIFSKIREWAANNAAPVEENEAVVVAKRTSVGGGESTSTSYFVTFELRNNERRELSLRGGDYGALAEGDVGTLRSQGTRFLSFVRRNDPYNAANSGEALHKCPACGATYRGSVCEYCGTPWVEPQTETRWH